MGNVKASYYCVLPANIVANQTTPWLLHYSATGSCPINPTPACGSGTFDLVAQDVVPLGPGGTYFLRDDPVNGVQLLFQVGASTTSTSILRTKTYETGNTEIPIQRVYTDTVD
jgi:hypothetical protein